MTLRSRRGWSKDARGHVLSGPPPRPHRCELPRDELRDAVTHEKTTDIASDCYMWPGVGTVWQCDECSAVWVAEWIPDSGTRFITCAHIEWRPETKRERRHREAAS